MWKSGFGEDNASEFSPLGDPSEEGELLTWLLYQMKEDTIENINRDLLFKMIQEEEFLGVFFCEYFILVLFCQSIHLYMSIKMMR